MTSKQTTDVQPEPEEQLSPGEIAQREAERDALLAKLAARPREDDGPAVDREAAAPAGSSSSKELAAAIEAERARHQLATEAADRAHSEKIADMVKQQQEAAGREARRVDVSVQDRLRAGTDALADLVVDTAGVAAEKERSVLQAQADALIASAKESLEEFEELWDEHRDEIERLSKIPNSDWLRGLPSEGHDATRGYGLAGQITNHVDQIQALVKNTPRAVEGLIREVRGLVAAAPLPANKDSARYMGWQSEWSGATRDLGRMGGSVPTLNSMVSNLSLLVRDLATIKKQYAGSAAAAKEPELDTGARYLRSLDQPNPNAPRPGRYVSMQDVDLWSEPKKR